MLYVGIFLLVRCKEKDFVLMATVVMKLQVIDMATTLIYFHVIVVMAVVFFV